MLKTGEAGKTCAKPRWMPPGRPVAGSLIPGCPVGPVLDAGNPTGYAHLLEILG